MARSKGLRNDCRLARGQRRRSRGASARAARAAADGTTTTASRDEKPPKPRAYDDAQAATKPGEAERAEPDAPRPPRPKSAAKRPTRPKPDELPRDHAARPEGEPWPDATPPPMKPVEPARARTETVGDPAGADLGAPPEMPTTSAPPPLALGAVENPAHMPGPREIPGGRARRPGARARRTSRPVTRARCAAGNEFALIYRVRTFVISRFGVVGTRGQWRVVEYPTSASASHAYAKECSRFVSEGFSDYRE